MRGSIRPQMKRQRTNHRGSIDKVNYQLADGTSRVLWRVRLSVADANGALRRVSLYATTNGELLEKMARFKATGVAPRKRDQRETIATYLARWLKDTVRLKVRHTTLQCYESVVRTHLVPRLGTIDVEKLTPKHVRAMLSAMEVAGASGRLRQLAHIVLRSALKAAVRDEIVPRNVCDAVDKPNAPARTMTTLSGEQIGTFLRAARDSRYFALYVLALTLGMRRGELLALQWDDLDLERGFLSVKHTLGRVNGEATLSEPKTAAGRRRIDLPRRSIEALREHRRRLMAEGLRASSWVFPNQDGEPTDGQNLVHRSFQPLLKAAGIPHVRFHDLRHSAATVMLASGVPAKVAQERLGHSSIAVTLDIYSHVTPTMQREAAEIIDAAFDKIDRAAG